MKRALVLTGGGARGAFQVGALMHIIGELGLQFDVITGTSVGALNGSFLAQYKKDQGRQAVNDLHGLWLGVENKTIKKHWKPFFYLHALWKQSLYSSAPLEKLVEDNLDAERIRNSGIELSVLAVSLDTGQARHFRETNKDIKDAVKASAAFPVFFEPVLINGEYYVDGGVRETAPLNQAIRMGAEHITIINTGPLSTIKAIGKKLKTLNVALRSIDMQGTEVINGDLRHFAETNRKLTDSTLIDDSKQVIEQILVTPDYELIDNPLEFDPQKIRTLILDGYNKARKVFKNQVDQ